MTKTFLLPLLRICPLQIKSSHTAIPCDMHSLYFQCPEYIHDPSHSPQSTHLSFTLPGVTPQSLCLRPCSPLLCPRSLSAGCSILPNNHGVHLGLLQLPSKNLWSKHVLVRDATILACCFSYACRNIHVETNIRFALVDLHATWPVSSPVPILSCWHFQ